MTASGGNTNEMGIESYTDQEIETVLTGSSELDPVLADAIAELRSTAIEMPAESLAAHHITMAANEALLTARDAEPAQTQRRPRKRVRRKTVFASITSTLIGKILAGSVALAATGGSVAAATGNLPDPVQAVVSEAVDVVGIDLPHPDDVTDVDDHPSIDDLLEADAVTGADDHPSDDDLLGADDHEAVENHDHSGDDDQREADENEATEADEAVEADENEATEADETVEPGKATEASEAVESAETSQSSDTEATEATDSPDDATSTDDD